MGIEPCPGLPRGRRVLGPLGLGSISNAFPGLSWFTISDAQNVAGIAELGIVFLLFLIGLELSFPRLSAMRRLVVGLGGSQVLLTSALIAGAAVAAERIRRRRSCSGQASRSPRLRSCSNSSPIKSA